MNLAIFLAKGVDHRRVKENRTELRAKLNIEVLFNNCDLFEHLVQKFAAFMVQL